MKNNCKQSRTDAEIFSDDLCELHKTAHLRENDFPARQDRGDFPRRKSAIRVFLKFYRSLSCR